MKILFITLAFVASTMLVNAATPTTSAASIKFPVMELGNCKDTKDCHVYCEKPENILKCVDFGERNGMIPAEDAVKARKFSDALKEGGPGKCQNQRTCEEYCEKTSHINECLAFAEKHELIPLEQLKEAKTVAKALQDAGKLPGGCKDRKICEEYCSKETNQSECLEFGKKFGLISEDILNQIEESLKQAPPEVQGCIKSLMSSASEKMKNGKLKGTSDIQTFFLNCLQPGTKIPPGGGINMESLKYMEKFYGSSLSPKDLESLKKAQEQLKGIIPQGTEIPSDGKSLNMEDVKNLQEKMQKDLEEQYKKMTPEELEYIKKMQEQGQFDNPAPPEIQGGGSGMGI